MECLLGGGGGRNVEAARKPFVASGSSVGRGYLAPGTPTMIQIVTISIAQEGTNNWEIFFLNRMFTGSTCLEWKIMPC